MFANPLGLCALLALVPLSNLPGDDVGGLLEPIRARHNLPALAAAAVRAGEIVAIGATGVRKVGASDAVTVEDKWHIGSCTKSMTASLAAMLVEDGKLKWDTTVGEVFPELRGVMRETWRGVTLEQLLTHRSGAPGNPPDDLWKAAWRARGTPVEQRKAFVGGLLGREPEAKPGTKFIYSNQGFAIAGAMIERIAAKPWEELLRARLFVPLGLKSGGFGAPGSPNHVDQPWGHVLSAGSIEPVPPGPAADNPVAIAPAGIVHCSIGDLARYAGWHARGARGDRPLLTETSFAKLHHAAEGQDYAMGWGVVQRGWAGGAALTHSGSNKMWYAVMWVAPEKDAAFVAATNIAGPEAEKACDEAVAALLGRVVPRDGRDTKDQSARGK